MKQKRKKTGSSGLTPKQRMNIDRAKQYVELEGVSVSPFAIQLAQKMLQNQITHKEALHEIYKYHTS